MLPPPELRSRSDAVVDMTPQVDLDGSIKLVVILKQRFRIDAFGRTWRIDGAEVNIADVPWEDDDEESPTSFRMPSDLYIRKPATDVLVAGNAWAPEMKPVEQVDCLVQVGSLQKRLRVFGPRVWHHTMIGVALTAPEPFEKCPVRWELAWGGMESADGKYVEEPRNPVGRGLVVDSSTLIQQEGPRIEDPDDLIATARSRPKPAGVAPVNREWEPRRKFLGTIDEEWKETRMPLMPLDFDDRFNQTATEELIARGHLRGGEPVQLVGFTPGRFPEFTIPRLAFFVGAKIDREMREFGTVLDTVLIQPEHGHVDLGWRAIVPLPRPAHRLEFVQVHEKKLVS